MGAALIMTVPLPWVMAALTAAAVHEACHAAAILALGGRIEKLYAGSSGAVMDMVSMDNSRELAAAAAGPVGSLLLILLEERFPRLAVCGLIQGCFNLFPIYPMDGGRILTCALRYFFGEARIKTVMAITEAGVLFLILLIEFWLIFHYDQNEWSVIGIFLLMIRIIHGKIPCKHRPHNVQ